MAVKQVSTQEGINPQIIPMIDIMFLLLLFFMLGADMGQRELEDVRLPQAEGVKPPAPEEVQPLTVNCYHPADGVAACPRYASGEVCTDPAHWRIGIRGEDVAPERLAAFLEPFAAARRLDPLHPLQSETPVQIRADASAVYATVQAVIAACSEVGIYKVEVGAASMEGAVVARE